MLYCVPFPKPYDGALVKRPSKRPLSVSFSVAVDVSCLASRPLTGVGYYTRNLFNAAFCADAPPEFRFFASNAGRLPSDLKWSHADVSRFRTLRFPTRWKNRLWTQWEWPPMSLLLGHTDLVHGGFHLLPPDRKARRVVTIFDLAGMRLNTVHGRNALATHRALLAHAAANADGLFAISKSCRDDAIELLGADPARMHIVPGGVTLEHFQGPLDPAMLSTLLNRLDIHGDYLLHLGTLEPRKNLPRLIEAYARIRGRGRDVPQLVLAGGKGWLYAPIFEAIDKHKLSSAVVWTDYLSRGDAIALLRGARGCVYPSLYEGFGLPVLEAMAARVPVLTSNVSSLPEVVGDTGILVEPESVNSIEAGLERLIAGGDDLASRIEAAFQRACGMTWDHSARALLAAYASVLEEVS